jgi:hypothetical protein
VFLAGEMVFTGVDGGRQGDSQQRQLPVKDEARRAGLITGPQMPGRTDLPNELGDRLFPTGIVPRLRTSTSASSTATAIVSAWISKPNDRNVSLMTGSLRLWLWTDVPQTNSA